MAQDVRRPKPLIPLRTALNNVSSSSNTSLSLIPAVLMLTRIASARNGERMTSITTDARFLVVLIFIRIVHSTSDAMQCCFADEHQVYNPCASGPTAILLGLQGNLSPVVDN